MPIYRGVGGTPMASTPAEVALVAQLTADAQAAAATATSAAVSASESSTLATSSSNVAVVKATEAEGYASIASDAKDAVLAVSSYQPTAVLEAIKQVDGASSGLDADTVDGFQSSVLTKHVDNISSLLSAQTIGAVNVLNYHSGLEGGGGVFYWDATGNATEHNGGTVISPLAVFPTDWDNQTQLATWFDGSGLVGTGVWRRQYDGAVNVKWFGAKGDNTDILTPFNSIVLFLKGKGGGEILFENGEFYSSDTLVVNSDNTYINAKPNSRIWSDQVTTIGGLVSFGDFGGNGVTNTVTNVGIYGGGTVDTVGLGNENAISFVRAFDYFCKDMKIPFADRKAITVQSGSSSVLNGTGYIQNNTIGTTGHDAIAIENATIGALYLENNTIEFAGRNGITIEGTSVPTVHDNVFVRSNTIGASTQIGIYGYSITKLTLDSNIVQNSGHQGISLNLCHTVREKDNIITTTGRESLKVYNSTFLSTHGTLCYGASTGNNGQYVAVNIGNISSQPVLSSMTIGGVPNYSYAVYALPPQKYTLVSSDLTSGLTGSFAGGLPDVTNCNLDGNIFNSKLNIVNNTNDQLSLERTGTNPAHGRIWAAFNQLNFGNNAYDASLVLKLDGSRDVYINNGTFNGGHLVMGTYHIWVDTTGKLRIKSSAPTTATDGTVVGAQT
jgi:hypothetical protein